MSIDRCAVERQHKRTTTGLGQRLENCPPSISFGPTIEAIVDCRIRTVIARAIALASARLHHMNDATEDAPVIVALGSLQSTRQMRRHASPLLLSRSPPRLPASRAAPADAHPVPSVRNRERRIWWLMAALPAR